MASASEPGRLEICTIGHSNHPIETFLDLLVDAGITAVADVRSVPYSRRHPQFRKDRLDASLKAVNIAYVFLGEELGARPKDRDYYVDGRADYEKIAASEAFQRGLVRVEEGAKHFRIALMCAEREPLDCHRMLLVSRHLMKRGMMKVRHILGDGAIEDGESTERRLVSLMGLADRDLFSVGADERQIRDEAYRRRIDGHRPSQ